MLEGANMFSLTPLVGFRFSAGGRGALGTAPSADSGRPPLGEVEQSLSFVCEFFFQVRSRPWLGPALTPEPSFKS